MKGMKMKISTCQLNPKPAHGVGEWAKDSIKKAAGLERPSERGLDI